MKRSIVLALIVGLGLISVAQGQDGRPAEERVRSSGRASAAEPDSPATTIVLSQENQTAEPRLVKFGGVLTDSIGRPLSGEVEVTFALYKQETDEEPLWKETQKLQLDKQGSYTALIGATQHDGVPVELFRSDEARWLGVQIQGEPQRPRILLVSVPYALKAVEAEKLGGKSASDFVLSENLGEQVRQVIQAQGQATAQPTLAATATGTLQPIQTKSNSTFTPQVTAAGPVFPPSTFSGANTTQIVRVQQNGSGNGLYAQTASTTGNSGVVGIATSTSTASYQNGVYGQNAGAGAGVAGIATNPAAGVGVYGQGANFAGVFGQTFNPNTNGVSGSANATTGFSVGVSGFSASTNGAGVFGNAVATSGTANGVQGQTASPFGAGVFGIGATNGQSTGVYGQTVNWVGVGGQALALSGGPAYGVWGDSVSTEGAGVAGYEDATSGFTYGVFGQSVSPNGTGVFAFNGASVDGIGVRGIANGTSGFANGVVGESSSPNGNGVIAQNRASYGGVGVMGVADATSGPSNGVNGLSFSPNGNGVFGGNNAANGGIGLSGLANATAGNAYGVYGATATTGFGAGVLGTAFATNGTAYGVFADAHSPNGNAIFGLAESTSGYPSAVVGFLDSQQGGVAGQFVAHGGAGLILQGLSGSNFNQVFSVDANGNMNISGNLTVSGTKSSTTKLQNGREVALYAVESPENWFEDFGTGELKNGLAWVPLESSFAEATSAAVTYHVFLTPNGDSNGLYVARKTAAGFEVKEHGGSGSNVAFDYRIVVRRRGYETMRMAEVHGDANTLESARQHLTELANTGNLKKMGAMKLAEIAPIPTAPPRIPGRINPMPKIRPAPPQPGVPQQPKPNVPQLPRTQ